MLYEGRREGIKKNNSILNGVKSVDFSDLQDFWVEHNPGKDRDFAFEFIGPIQSGAKYDLIIVDDIADRDSTTHQKTSEMRHELIDCHRAKEIRRHLSVDNG